MYVLQCRYDLFMYCRHGMVVRLGGSSCSVSCFSVTNGLYKLLSSTDTSDLGGDMFTELIADHFAKDFLRFVAPSTASFIKNNFMRRDSPLNAHSMVQFASPFWATMQQVLLVVDKNLHF